MSVSTVRDAAPVRMLCVSRVVVSGSIEEAFTYYVVSEVYRESLV